MARQSISLFKALEGFVRSKEAAGKSESTIRNYRATIAKLRVYFGNDDPELNTLDRAAWEEVMAWLQSDYISDCNGVARREPRHLSPKTCCNIHTDLSSFYTWATSPGVELVPDHIFRHIERPGFERPLIEPLTKTDIEKLLKACDTTSSWSNRHSIAALRPTRYRDRAIIHILLSTGVRASELCDIRFRDLDMASRTIAVAGKGRGRDSKPRQVHFGKTASAALWRYISDLLADSKPEDHVFVVDINGIPRPMDRAILLRVNATSSGDGTGSPLGWLCPTTIAAQLRRTAPRNTSAIRTIELFSGQPVEHRQQDRRQQPSGRTAADGCGQCFRAKGSSTRWVGG